MRGTRGMGCEHSGTSDPAERRRTQILDGRAHLGHSDDVGDGSDGSDDAAKGVGVLLAELLKEDDAELGQERVLLALLDHDRELARQVRRLLAHLSALVVEPPEDGRDDLGDRKSVV